MESVKELRKICRRADVIKPQIIVRIIRFFSIYFTWFFLHFKKFTANQLTVVSTVIFVAGVFCYIKGDYSWNIAGLLLIWLGIITDYSDGEMARYQRASLEKSDPNKFAKLQMKGTALESLTHDIKYGALFASLALGTYASFSYPTLLLFLGFSASMAQVLGRLTKLRYIHSVLPVQTEKVYLQMSENKFYAKRSSLRLLIDKTFGSTLEIVAWLSLATILDKVYLIVLFYGILFPMIYSVLLYKQYKGFQKI